MIHTHTGRPTPNRDRNRRSAALHVRVVESQRQPQPSPISRPGMFPTYRDARRVLLINTLAELLIAIPILVALGLLVLHLQHVIP